MHQFLILCSLKLTWRKVLSVVVKKSDTYVKNTFALTPSSCSLAKIPASCKRKKVKFQKKVHFMSFSCEIHFFPKVGKCQIICHTRFLRQHLNLRLQPGTQRIATGKQSVRMKGDDRHTLRKRNPSAPNRSRSYDLPICTSDSAPLSDRRIVAG